MNLLDQLLLLALATFLILAMLGDRRWAGWLSVALYAGQGWLLAQMMATVGDGIASRLAFRVLGETLQWRMDGLGWFFAVVTVGSALLCAWYAAGEWGARQPRMRLFHAVLALNVLVMLLLLASGDLLSLFIGWELVTWAGYLMMVQRGGPAAAAAYRYLIYAVAGAMALLSGLVLARVELGSFGFEAVRAGIAAAPDSLVLMLLLLLGGGFAVKMALFPLHRWQADAYAEAPGAAAAFLGAISSRMGLFALLIVLLQLIGIERLAALEIPYTFLDQRDLWAWIAAITIVVPTFIALRQSDARMLLAWHGIGQGGYMLLGLMVASPLAAAGGLMHVINHALYQAPLFLVVAAVVHRTGTADLDRLGGLITRMPWSYAAMLLGIIGLAGMPPMNGFVSKWMVYKGLLNEGMPLLFIAAVLGTLGTILSVYKLIHNIFLGQLRLEHRDLQEAPWSMRAPMLILVGIAFLFGWMPGLALDLVALAQPALGIAMPAYHLGGVDLPNGQLNMLWVVGVLLGGIGFGAVLFYLVGGRTQLVHQYDNYAGGHFLTSDVRYQYSHNFYPGLMRVIGPLYRGSVEWLERAIGNGVGLLSAAMHGLYRAADGPRYLLWSLVAGLLVILVG